MKRLISIISVIALLCTMFSLPVMAEETNVIAKTNTQVNLSNHKNDKAAAYGFTQVAGENHVSADKHMGTHAHQNTYYRAFEADAFAAPKPVGAIFGEASGKICMNFTAYGSVWTAYKATTYGANDRIYFSTYVNNLDGKVHELGLMPSSAGVNMTKFYSTTLPKNVWTKVDVVYDPNVTFTYTVNGQSKTVSTVGKTIPQNINLGYAASSAGDANAQKKWTPILALDGSTYDANSTYVISKVQFGEYRLYINGELVHTSTSSASYNATSTNFYFYDALPSRFVFNKDGALAFSNAKFGAIRNFDAATYTVNQPGLTSSDAKYTVMGGKLLTTTGYVTKSSFAAPEGTVVKAYSKDSAVTVAGGYKYAEIEGDVVPEGSIVTVMENKDGGERISYVVAKDEIASFTCDSWDSNTVGNSNVAAVKGAWGKKADDVAHVVTPNGTSEDAFFVMGYGLSADQLMAYSGYMHISFNTLMENTDGKVFLRMSTDTGASVAANNSNYTASKIINPNQWNKVDVVLKLEGGKTSADAGKPNGTAKTYVNGKFIGENNTCFGGYASATRRCTALRVGINSKDTLDKLWVDDYKVVRTMGEPVIDEMPEAITANIGDAVDSVTAQGARVYEDAACKKLITRGTLAHGNVIVKEENGMYAYTNLKSDDIKHYMISSDTFEARARYDGSWENTGIGGKSADDYSLKLTKRAVGDDASDADKANYVNFYPQFIYNRGADAKDYVVIGFNFYVPSESLFRDVGIYSQQHTNLGVTIGSDYIARDKWNSLVNVIDYTSGKAKATMYLNGKTVGEEDRELGRKSVKDKDGKVIEYQEFGGSIFNQIRLSVVTNKYNDASSFYMDDIIVFETDEKFVPAKLTMADTFKSEYDIISGDKLYVAEDEELTVAEIKADFENAVVTRAGAVLEDSAVVAKNDVVFLGEVDNYVQGLAGYKSVVYAGNTFGTNGIRMYKEDGATTVKPGDKVNVRVAKVGVLVVASYDENDVMTAVDTDLTASASYKEITMPSGYTVSFIGVDNLDNLTPAGKNLVFDFSAN